MRKRSEWYLIAVLGLCSVLLPILALLQYRWLGQLSAAEQVRMRRSVQLAAEQLTQEFDLEISRVQASLQTGRLIAERDSFAEYSERFHQWKANASHPRLVRHFYLTSGEDGVSALWMLDPSSGSFSAMPWPALLSALRGRLAAWPPSSGFRSGPPLADPVAVEETWPLLVTPRLTVQPGSPGPPGPPFARPRPPSGWSIVELDSDYIATDYLPELVRKYLAEGGNLDYRVQVITRTAPARIVFDSEPGSGSGIVSAPDAAAQMFLIRPEPFGRRRGRPSGEPPGQMFGRRGPPPAGASPGRADSANRGGGGPGQPAPRLGPGDGLWTLLARHHAGSVENVVAGVRRRNLAISSAVLLMLGAGIVALVITARRAQKLAELQMEFVAGVSHELRTPLSVIRMAGQNLADGVSATEKQVRQYGQLIRDEEGRLSDTVEQVLAYAKAGLGRMQFEHRPVVVEEVIERAVAACQPELRQSGCRIDLQLEPDLPPIQADATALTHCLRNLLSNAARHGRQGGAIRVRAARDSTARDRIEIQVEDEGPGIKPADLSHLFEPFYRGQRAQEQQVRGLGLGLALVKRIMDAHGGAISVASAPEKGTCFTLKLPLADATAPGAAAQAE